MAEQPLEAKGEKKDALEKTFEWPSLKGFYLELFLKAVLAKMYGCGLCGLVAKDVVELICPQHANEEEDDDDDSGDDEGTTQLQVYCQKCLEDYLAENGNLCPISKHEAPKWQKSSAVNKSVGKLKIRCPRTLKKKKR